MTNRLSISGILPNPSRRVSIALRIIAPLVVGAVLLAVSLTGASGASGINETVIEDDFSGPGAIDGRTPTPVSTGATWSDAAGDWATNNAEFAHVDASVGQNWTVIETGISDSTVETEVFWKTGDKAGVVARFSSTSTWVMAWFDGTNLTLEESVGGTATTIATASPVWDSDTQKTISITLDGQNVTVSLDGVLEISATSSSSLLSNTKAGMYATNTLTTFDSFKVMTLDLVADAGPDQSADTDDVVTLDGSASESFSLVDSTLTFSWTQASGTVVTLSSTSTASPTFTAPPVSGVTELTFELQVTDVNGSTTDTVSIFVGPGSDPFGTTYVSDTFTDDDDTFLSAHASDTASTTWASISGKWIISSDAVFETSGSLLVDHRAVIDAEIADGTVQADITVNSDSAGLVTRYATESDWMMVWFDDNLNETPGTGDIILAQVVDGVFTLLGESIGVVWGAATGTTRTLSVTTDGQDITVELDSSELITATSSDLTASTRVGMFSRASSTNAFDNFLVSALPLTADAGPDQVVVPESGTTTLVTLDGTNSVSSNITDSSLTYAWTQDSGLSVTLSSATEASPTFDASVATSTEQYIFTLEVTDIDGSATDTVSILVTGVSAAPAGTTFVEDTFTDVEGTLLADHIPDTASSTWTTISGDWEIGSNAGIEISGTTFDDHRAIIDSQTADGTVQADITLNGSIAGLVTRYSDESNWIMAWFDDNRDETPGTGDIVLAQNVSGIFTILGESIGVVWGASSTRTLAIKTDGEDITVSLDAVELISATSSDLSTSTSVGLFARATSTNVFDNFLVSILPLSADAGSDQTVVSESGIVMLTGSGLSHNITDSTIQAFLWTQTSGTSVAELFSATSSSATFDAPAVTNTEELVFTLQVTDIDGSATDTVSILVTPESPSPAADTLIEDIFTDLAAVSLADHVPDTASSTWSVISGDWSISSSEKAEETSGSDTSDHRAVIDAASGETIVQADITFGGGKFGLVTRYGDEANWIVAWFDDDRDDQTSGTGDIILAQLVEGVFSTLGESAGVNWIASSSTRTLSLTTSRNDVTVELDGIELISATSSALNANTSVGLFSRASSTNVFDNFLVSIPPFIANAGPDQSVTAGSGTVTLDGTDSRSHSLVDQSLTYAWAQDSGTSVSLSSATSSNPTFPAPSSETAEELVFTVIVTETVSSATSSDSVSIFVSPESASPSGDTLVEDTFTDITDVLLADHAPDTATSTWSVISGDWSISSSDDLEETSGTDGADRRAVIDAGSGETIVQADISLGGGVVGLITRYADESNWIMAWFDDNRDEVAGTGDIVLAQVVGGVFTTLGESVGVNWTASSSTPTLSLITSRDDVTVELDGIELISATSSALNANTSVGLFSRASSTNVFDNFLVSIPPF
ncbi:MAG: hypothetical protein IH868_05415, partial [Chloroflexi bacterium]|nr:hypothetical protein [Chloroflexota bacterium]